MHSTGHSRLPWARPFLPFPDFSCSLDPLFEVSFWQPSSLIPFSDLVLLSLSKAWHSSENQEMYHFYKCEAWGKVLTENWHLPNPEKTCLHLGIYVRRHWVFNWAINLGTFVHFFTELTTEEELVSMAHQGTPQTPNLHRKTGWIIIIIAITSWDTVSRCGPGWCWIHNTSWRTGHV